MRIPDVLSSLVDQGVIERVVRPLMSGKEAQIYLVEAGGNECVAKIYKEADNRTFKHRADYTEGRKVRNTRDQRAINKRSQHGRDQDEAAWRSTEVDMIYRLRAAGVRVPEPYNFIDSVLIMELVTDGNGQPAARLGEIDFTPQEAKAVYDRLVQDVVRMLCAGVVHGDLSDFNVLLGADGPVIIDFPQSVDPSKNQNARKLLIRDVDNLHRFYARFVPNGPRVPYAEEMWALYESNRLTPETVLRGQYRGSQKKANVDALMEFIGDVNEDERRRRTALGRDTSAIPAKPRRVEVIVEPRAARGAAPGTPRTPDARAERPDLRGPRAPDARAARPDLRVPRAPDARGPRPDLRVPRAPDPRGPRAPDPRAAARAIAAPIRAIAAPPRMVPPPPRPAPPVPPAPAPRAAAPAVHEPAPPRAAAPNPRATASTDAGPSQAPARRRRRRRPKARQDGAALQGNGAARPAHPQPPPDRTHPAAARPNEPRNPPRSAPRDRGDQRRDPERATRPAPGRVD